MLEVSRISIVATKFLQLSRKSINIQEIMLELLGQRFSVGNGCFLYGIFRKLKIKAEDRLTRSIYGLVHFHFQLHVDLILRVDHLFIGYWYLQCLEALYNFLHIFVYLAIR